MSGHNTGPGPQPHHTWHPAIRAAAAAIILLALGACSSTTITPGAGTTDTAAAAVPSGGPGILTGAGSTYVAPFFALAFARYHQQHPAVTVNYSAVGSSAGIAAISARQVDFGASDVPMNASELAAAKGGPITQVPDALGAEGVAYNLNLPAGARLRLTGPVIAAIFLGQITRWNDPAITVLNPGITLPGASIAVVHRSDGSGTTYIFSNYLSSVDPAWAAKVGTGKTLNWPAGEGAEGNASVTADVFRTPFSIGYVEQAYSQGLRCRSPPSATRPETTSCRPPRPSPPPPPRNPPSRPPTSPSSTSPAPAATPSAATAGRWSTPTSPARPPGRNWSPCWTGSPTTARPTPPRTSTCPCQPRSGNSPLPCSSRSPAPAGHTC